MSDHFSSWSSGLCPKAMRFSCSFFSRLRSIWIPPGRDLGAEFPGRSGSCGGATGSLPASQRADGFPPNGSEGTVHTDCLARWIGSANMRLSPRRGEPPYQQGIACPAYTVNYLFRLLPVSIKRDRAPGSTVRDGRTFRVDCRMAESTHALIDTLSKAMWIRRHGYRAVPNQGQPHPGEIVLLLLLRKKSQNRKVWNCKLFVNAERLLRQHWASLNGSQKNRFLMRLAGFGVCDGRSVPRTDPQRQGRSSPAPARRRADSCQRSR